MTSPGSQENSNALGYGLAGLIVLLFVSASFCSKKDSSPGQSVGYENYVDAAANLEVAAEPSVPLPLDNSAVLRGGAQLRLIASLGLAGSRQIFSQNCYDALGKSFDWHQLDRCGGFDAAVVRWADQGAALTATELEYFGPEAAATRYLTAATSNGLAGSDADQRWASLELAVDKLPMPKAAAATEDSSVDANAAGEADVGGEQDSEPIDDPLAPAGATRH